MKPEKKGRYVTTTKYSFEDYAQMDPRIDELARDVAAADKGGPRFCMDEAWYGRESGQGFKARMLALAGYEREGHNPTPLATSNAYHVVLQRLYYELMPDCRGCGCDQPRKEP